MRKLEESAVGEQQLRQQLQQQQQQQQHPEQQKQDKSKKKKKKRKHSFDSIFSIGKLLGEQLETNLRLLASIWRQQTRAQIYSLCAEREREREQPLLALPPSAGPANICEPE